MKRLKENGLNKRRSPSYQRGQTAQISTSHTFSLRLYDLHREKTGTDDLMFFAGGGKHMPLPAPVRKLSPHNRLYGRIQECDT